MIWLDDMNWNGNYSGIMICSGCKTRNPISIVIIRDISSWFILELHLNIKSISKYSYNTKTYGSRYLKPVIISSQDLILIECHGESIRRRYVRDNRLTISAVLMTWSLLAPPCRLIICSCREQWWSTLGANKFYFLRRYSV